MERTKSNSIARNTKRNTKALFLALGMGLSVSLIPNMSTAGSEFIHPGYIDDIKEERLQVVEEVVIVPYLEGETNSLATEIFTEKMTKDFSYEFRRRFGHTEFEQLSFTSSRNVEGADLSRIAPADEYIAKQEQFGQYMGKELAEFHVDKYLKGNRSTREIYKVKQAISNIEVKAEGGYKVKIRYKITSGRLTVKLEKPNEKFHKQIDSHIDGGDAAVRFAYDVTKSVRVGSDFQVEDQVVALRGEKRLTSSLSTSITGQSYTRDIGTTPKQERVLLGLTWSD